MHPIGLRTIPALRNFVLSGTILSTTAFGFRTKPRVNTLTTQAFPLTGFYQLLLEHPQTPSEHPAYYPPGGRGQPSQQPASNPKEEADSGSQPTRAQLVFGSRLVGPLRVRTNDANSQSQMIAGVSVPPKPKEPDNCCMSGCVNCVWDVFREDLEEWAAANARAQVALKRQYKREAFSVAPGGEVDVRKDIVHRGRHEYSSQIRDQGVTLGKNMWEGLEDIPIGIRVFMDTEKVIKSRSSDKNRAASTSDIGD
ncbi:hypothetical protein TWF481_011749 [Arthrobotrys musiformis]|uniref:Oxidoreductase-like domain-containing protein n=1 Tax=Arthrobotrys musiformis TaxID=47236 RepID=A0AAV9VXE7_9PEZI